MATQVGDLTEPRVLQRADRRPKVLEFRDVRRHELPLDGLLETGLRGRDDLRPGRRQDACQTTHLRPRPERGPMDTASPRADP